MLKSIVHSKRLNRLRHLIQGKKVLEPKTATFSNQCISINIIRPLHRKFSSVSLTHQGAEDRFCPSPQPTLRQPFTSTIPTTSAALPWSLTTKAELPRTWCIFLTARCLWKSAMAVGLLPTCSTPKSWTRRQGCIIMGRDIWILLLLCG